MKKNSGPAIISVIVPVLNEEKIQKSIRHIQETAAGEQVEIIVVDGDPNGNTIKRINDHTVTKLSSPSGRGAQMNCGAAAAKGDILLFLHADTTLPSNAFRQIKQALRDPHSVGGAFGLAIDSTSVLLRLTARAASLKHRITRVPYGDQAIFMRAGFFREIGGYRDMPLFEDVEIMRRIKKLKKNINLLQSRAHTSARKWEKDGIIYTLFRNWTLQILYLLGVSPKILVKYYYKN